MLNVNSGKPWSEMDIRDLKVALQYSRTVAEIADFLCRDVEEVEAKIAELRRHCDPAFQVLRVACRQHQVYSPTVIVSSKLPMRSRLSSRRSLNAGSVTRSSRLHRG
jgi:hypothetical protein